MTPSSLKQPFPPWTFWLVLAIYLALIHYSTFKIIHNEGDELVYLSLAESMTWKLENYSTKDASPANTFPARMYRADYFLHPPFFPLLLKTIGNLPFPDSVVGIALFLHGLIHGAICLVIARFLAALGKGMMAQIVAATTAAFCPVLLGATIKLHADGWIGFLMLLTGFLLLRAWQRKRIVLFFWAGVVYGVALNTKLTALATLPGFCLVSWYCSSSGRRSLWLSAFWCPTLLLLAPHVCQLLWHYGTLYPGWLLVHDFPTERFPLLVRVLQRTHLHAALYTIGLSPFIVLLLSPQFWRSAMDWLRRRSAEMVPLVLFANLALSVWIVHYATERYWAIYLPMFYVHVGMMTENYIKARQWNVFYWVGLVWVLMSASSVRYASYPQNDMINFSLLLFIPDLQRWYI